MKRTAVLLFALTLIFSSGLFAASAFQKTLEKRGSEFNGQRPLLVLGFDVTREDVEKYEVKTFIPDVSWKAKLKKFFTKKEYGAEQIDVYTRKVTITKRLKLYTLDKKKAYRTEEVTVKEIAKEGGADAGTEIVTNTKVSAVKIYTDNEFWDVKRGVPPVRTKVLSLDFIAMGVLPDWIFMHSSYMKEAIETSEKLNDKTFRFINAKWIRYYVDTDTFMPNTIEVDSKEGRKAVLYKITFSPETFTYGRVTIPKKAFIHKDNKPFREYQISVLSAVDRLNDMVFDPALQAKELNRTVPPKN